MNHRITQHRVIRNGLMPFLFGFLLLGAVSHPPARHDRQHAAGAPAQRPAFSPRQLRVFADGEAAMQVMAPLPDYVPELDPDAAAAARARSWSI